MNRLTRNACLVSVTFTLLVCGVTSTASATGTGSATAKAAQGGPTNITMSAPLGSGLLGATVASLVQPIVDGLTNAINTQMGTAVRGLLNSSGNTADTTTGPAAYPTGPLGKVAIPGLLSANLYGPQGSVTASASAYAATSSFTSAEINAFNIRVGDLTVGSASVNCPAIGTGSPTSTVAMSDINLVGGLVRARMASGKSLTDISLNQGSWQSINGVGTHLTTVPGHADLQIATNGSYLQVSQTIGVSRLLAGLGLGGLFSGLPGQVDTNDSNLTLSITVGPGSAAVGTTGIEAWGLAVGVDVSGTIAVKQLSSLGILGGTALITVPTGITGTHLGNLLDLKLAYANCTSGALAQTKPIPPALI
ncbi:MAG: hypothetical protein ABR604_06350 [Jatrophihabitantaceae bacterium]